MVWRDEHKDAFVSHMLENETVLQSFRNSIRNQEHQSCYKHFLDLNTLAATGMTTRRMSRRMQLGLPMAPWYDATCRDYKRRIRWNKKHNQPFAELQLPAEKKQFKKEMADEMVGLTDARSPEVYKLLTANKLSDTSPISAEMWTEHFQFRLCNHKRALLTCYLEDPTNLHGIIYSVTSYDLDKFLLLTLQFHPALVAGTGA